YLPDYIYNITLPAKIKLRQNKITEARQLLQEKHDKYPKNLEIMQLYSLALFKNGEIDKAQKLARKTLVKDPNSLTALMVLAEACRIKNDYTCALSYWESIQKIAPQNAFANLALIDLYAKTKNFRRLDQEIRLLYCLLGPFTLEEYIKELTRDGNLLPYLPEMKNYLFIKKNAALSSQSMHQS
ncbi:tetratricopeptide repeat protein, partial [bacterium]|nr:tetratricopeptide repeat protein [bacterium]